MAITEKTDHETLDYCPVLFPDCPEDAASCDCSFHENLRAAEASHQEPPCCECGYPATINLINWYCDVCYAHLKETHREN